MINQSISGLVVFIIEAYKGQPHKIVKHIQTICQQQAMNFFSVFDHLIKLGLKITGANILFFGI